MRTPLQAFYKAVHHHQDYAPPAEFARMLQNKGYVDHYDIPKLMSFRQEFPELEGGK